MKTLEEEVVLVSLSLSLNIFHSFHIFSVVSIVDFDYAVLSTSVRKFFLG